MNFPTKQLRTLSGHTGPVHCVTYSSGQGQYVLTGSSDRSIRLWNPGNGTKIQSFEAHAYEVLDIAVTDGNDRIASVGGDKTVFLWDVATARTLRRFTGHFARVNCVDFGGDGSICASGSYDSSVRLWDCKSQATKPIQILDEGKDSVTSLQIAGHEILTGSVDGRVRIYDLRMGQCYIDLMGHPVTSIRQTKDGNAVLVSTLDSTIRLMDRSNGKLLQSYKGHINTDYRIRSCLALNDAYVLSGSEDGKIYIWSLLKGEAANCLDAHDTKVVSAVAFCTGTRLEWCSASVDGTVTIWGS